MGYTQGEIQQDTVSDPGPGKGRRRPTGVIILGGLNCALGLLFFVVSVTSYMNATFQDLDRVTQAFKNQAQEIYPDQDMPEITHEQLRAALMFQSAVFFLFFVSGVGILLGKEWGRKLIVYFSFAFAALIFVVTLFNSSFIRHLAPHIVYLGILIIYFTNKKVEQYFLS